MNALLAIVSGIILFLAVFAGMVFLAMYGTRWTERYLIQLRNAFKVAALIAAAPLAIYWGFILLNAWTLRLLTGLNIREWNVLIAAGIFIIGGAAYWLKRTRRRWFGIIELAFAWFSAVTISLTVNGQITSVQVLAIIGTIYLVTSSLDHYFGNREAQVQGEPKGLKLTRNARS